MMKITLEHNLNVLFNGKSVLKCSFLFSGYVTCILDDAKIFANHAKKKVIESDDVRMASQMILEKAFTTPPPREVNKAKQNKTIKKIHTLISFFFLGNFLRRFCWNWHVVEIQHRCHWLKHIVAFVCHPNDIVYCQPTINYVQPKFYPNDWPNQRWIDLADAVNPMHKQHSNVNQYQMQQKNK